MCHNDAVTRPRRRRGQPSQALRATLTAKELEPVLDEVVETAYATEIPTVLYHYTTWDAADAILTSQRLRATAHDCMNDPAELLAADDTIVAAAERLLEASRNRLCQAALRTFLAAYPKMHITKQVPTFVTCFSAEGNLHNQWRDYADGGAGVCMGIRLVSEAPPDSAECWKWNHQGRVLRRRMGKKRHQSV